jgi:hypothetical protein
MINACIVPVGKWNSMERISGCDKEITKTSTQQLTWLDSSSSFKSYLLYSILASKGERNKGMIARTGYQLDCLPRTCHNCGWWWSCCMEQWFCVGSDGGQRGAGPGEQILAHSVQISEDHSWNPYQQCTKRTGLPYCKVWSHVYNLYQICTKRTGIANSA